MAVPSFDVAWCCSTTSPLVLNRAGMTLVVYALPVAASASLSCVGVRKPSTV